jgi:hypothetical protein
MLSLNETKTLKEASSWTFYDTQPLGYILKRLIVTLSDVIAILFTGMSKYLLP